MCMQHAALPVSEYLRLHVRKPLEWPMSRLTSFVVIYYGGYSGMQPQLPPKTILTC